MTPRHQAYNLLHICISSPVFLYSVVSSHLQYLVAHSWFLIACCVVALALQLAYFALLALPQIDDVTMCAVR